MLNRYPTNKNLFTKRDSLQDTRCDNHEIAIKKAFRLKRELVTLAPGKRNNGEVASLFYLCNVEICTVANFK